jgi:tuftelin-interacting protein 11
MRIPEVRHNLRLIVDVAKGDLDGLAREAKALEERKKWVRNEDARLRRKVEEEAERGYIRFCS